MTPPDDTPADWGASGIRVCSRSGWRPGGGAPTTRPAWWWRGSLPPSTIQ